jgi:hypothetical protein
MAYARAHQTHQENCPTGLDGDLPSDSPRVLPRSSGLPSTVISEAGRTRSPAVPSSRATRGIPLSLRCCRGRLLRRSALAFVVADLQVGSCVSPFFRRFSSHVKGQQKLRSVDPGLQPRPRSAPEESGPVFVAAMCRASLWDAGSSISATLSIEHITGSWYSRHSKITHIGIMQGA